METENQNIKNAVLNRHSVRKFLASPIAQDKRDVLTVLADAINAEINIHVEVVFDEPNAFKKSLLAYGSFKNVRNYIIVAGPKNAESEILAGYYGEKLVLKAQELGLNTCWVGLTFSRKNSKVQLAEGEHIYCAIALGYGDTQGVQHKNKPAEKICPDYATMPDWFKNGVDMALLAPTAMNQQKFRFELIGDKKVRAYTKSAPYSNVDLGIARLHFEIGAGKDNFVWE